jgi:hypothetical protein
LVVGTIPLFLNAPPPSAVKQHFAREGLGKLPGVS